MTRSRSDALTGVRVALLESRMSGEMGELVRRHGGIPRCVPSVRETPIDCREPVAAFLRSLEPSAPQVVIFLTGVGVNVLFDEAERQERLPLLVEALSRATLVCRGPKPVTALKRRGLTPALVARDPFTSAEVLEALDACELNQARVVLIHYGELNDRLAAAIRARGACLAELCLYEWQLPEDTQPMIDLVGDVLAGTVDAVVFTSQVQGRHLLQIAAAMGAEATLVEALNTNVVVAAVGPVCRATLEESGIVPDVVPANPKMGPLIASLAEYHSSCRART